MKKTTGLIIISLLFSLLSNNVLAKDSYSQNDTVINQTEVEVYSKTESNSSGGGSSTATSNTTVITNDGSVTGKIETESNGVKKEIIIDKPGSYSVENKNSGGSTSQSVKTTIEKNKPSPVLSGRPKSKNTVKEKSKNTDQKNNDLSLIAKIKDLFSRFLKRFF